jgi:chitinase
VRGREGQVIVAFGGAANQELADACEDVAALTDAYAAVVDRYEVPVVDLDVEGEALADLDAAARRAEALAAVQAERAEDDEPLAVWLTLPVAPTGLTDDGVALLDATLGGGVDLAGVNVMTMDYGESRPADLSMLDASVAALDATHTQVGDAYRRAGQALTDTEVWARLGATPMLGRNDTPEDDFALADAQGLVAAAQARGLGRLSVWSLNRDLPCGPNDTGAASPYCSGTDAEAGAFAQAFAVVDGRASTGVAEALAASTGRETVPVDDPATSPHPIWDAGVAYVQGDRVVWRHNVYEAKWWSQDVAPDVPVRDGSATPWLLVGPVLPGDRPAPAPDPLPEGTHPAWSPAAVYHAGDVVQLDGVAYRAKWWSEGQAPDVDARDPFASPWAVVPVD